MTEKKVGVRSQTNRLKEIASDTAEHRSEVESIMSQSVIIISDSVERETYGFVALDSVEVEWNISRQITYSMHAWHMWMQVTK